MGDDLSDPRLIYTQPVTQLYDPATMSAPWLDPSGVYVATADDGAIVPVAVSSADIEWASPGIELPAGVVDLLTSGIQSVGTQLQRWLNPTTPTSGVTQGSSPLGTLTPTTMLLLGVGAYFLFFRR